ncbi:hypothetical protein AMS64_11950 [Aeromonas veronii]|uniref:hypothetical protein n=1 Tax=Aeromonas veronii TaxID=654 RepID=UPI00078BB2B2|nr:hypothetical protein [Aeromonas veronii]AMQ43031.1 hypothetical protein AMS64_11950 [Aeromonas veronii]MCX0425022.1 hypothetical protein [Aeromonas veronii]MCX0448515.1 hypothetical protein [Aeromonas veronii]POG19738.1 hypothetical protein C2849_06120 [Aeromonas veronii]
MSYFKSFEERLADQAKARARQAERIRKIKIRQTVNKRTETKPKTKVLSSTPPAAPYIQRIWAQVRAGSTKLNFQTRAAAEDIFPQPWTVELVNTLLVAADQRSTMLCLVWPAKLTSLPQLHALANLERQFAKDLRGLRTLLYPATHAFSAPLHNILVEKTQLSDLFRSLWEVDGGSTIEVSHTTSQSFIAALGAVNDIRIQHPELPNPSLAELVPTFIFDPAQHEWVTRGKSPLERTLSKVTRLANRRNLRQKISSEWSVPNKAPGALMAIHHAAKKRDWKDVLKSAALKSPSQPEILLFDATDAVTKKNYSAVKRIPEYLCLAHENGLSGCGKVIITDDPKTFFIFRSQLSEFKLKFDTKVLAVEADNNLFSTKPIAPNWMPALRSNSNFSVSIVDRDASQLALMFQKLMGASGSEENPAYHALLQASLYILRLSNLPAGYADLTSSSADAEAGNYSSSRDAWTPIKLAILTVLASGALNESRESVERAIARADNLIDDWNDATPMAARMLAEIKKHRNFSHHGISLVLPNNRYIFLARRFLQRKFGKDWVLVEHLLEWHTLPTVAKTLTSDCKIKHLIFIGVNPDVIRILLTHPGIPHRTVVLIAYRQAESTLKTLACMKEVGVFKAYRGRIGLLAQEIERRLAEVPNPIVINKLRDMPMTFSFEDNGRDFKHEAPTYYTFELEGGYLAYATGWVYRYEPDEDPLFRRVAVGAIQPGDFIFDMSDELRATLESSLQLNDEGVSSVVDPVRMLLKLYHDDVQRRCRLMFTSNKRSALAREIHAKMVALDPRAANCRPGRVYYWLALQAQDDTRPHASKDSKYFKVFCKALGISDEAADQHWGFVRNARRLNQHLGRELAARYAEILFQSESAAVYRKVPEDVIRQLQQDALRCISQVERVVPPPALVTTNKEGEASAHSQ